MFGAVLPFAVAVTAAVGIGVGVAVAAAAAAAAVVAVAPIATVVGVLSFSPLFHRGPALFMRMPLSLLRLSLLRLSLLRLSLLRLRLRLRLSTRVQHCLDLGSLRRALLL